MTTSQDIASRRGCAIRTVQDTAARLGIQKIAGRYIFTDEQAAAIESAIRPGPGWVKGRKRKA